MNVFIRSSGSSDIPIHEPLTNSLVFFEIKLVVVSDINFILQLLRNHLIIGADDTAVVILVDIARCLCKPTLPPSGVSTGSIYPHCEPCNNRGPITFALASSGRFNFLLCEIAELYDNLLRSCTTPGFLV